MNTALVTGYLVLGLPVGVYLAFCAFVLSGISLWGTGTTIRIALAFLVGWLFYPVVLLWLGLEKGYRTLKGY
jgi:hypothetical protein